MLLETKLLIILGSAYAIEVKDKLELVTVLKEVVLSFEITILKLLGYTLVNEMKLTTHTDLTRVDQLKKL